MTGASEATVAGGSITSGGPDSGDACSETARPFERTSDMGSGEETGSATIGVGVTATAFTGSEPATIGSASAGAGRTMAG